MIANKAFYVIGDFRHDWVTIAGVRRQKHVFYEDKNIVGTLWDLNYQNTILVYQIEAQKKLKMIKI